MKLSKYLELNKGQLINEQEFETLGILDSDVDKNICTFIDGEKYIPKIKPNITMLITTPELYS